jgi:hypothetical protein
MTNSSDIFYLKIKKNYNYCVKILI